MNKRTNIVLGMVIMIMFLTAGCTNVEIAQEKVNSPALPVNRSNLTVVNETKIAEDKAKAAEELVRLTELEKSINSTIEQCGSLSDDDNSWCFATEGVGLMKRYGRVQNLHPVYTLCELADDRDFCLFYAAAMLNGPGYCTKVEDKTGCELIADPLFCHRVINPNKCLLDRAMLVRIVSKEAAQVACDDMKNFNKYPDAKKYDCSEVDFGEAEYDVEPFKDRFFLMYVMTKLTGFEVDKTTAEDYAREVAEENEQD